MGPRGALRAAARGIGLWRASRALFGRESLAVLAYHRIASPGPGFQGFEANASATPEDFAAQMEWLAANAAPVSLEQVAAALGGESLPSRAVLVTFDDGYRDCLSAALPVMESLEVPMTVFLATDHIDSDEPLWWDAAAWCFDNASVLEADLPLLGRSSWVGGETRSLAKRWVAKAKTVGDREMRSALRRLPEVLGTQDPRSAGGLALDWDAVSVMAGRGVAFGAHTRPHPILSRVSVERMREEVAGSVARVAEATGTGVLGFAYPKGGRGDYGPEAVAAVVESGVPSAFTLVPGPNRASAMRRNPLEIRRVLIHHTDGLDGFVFKVSGLSRLIPALA